MSDDKGNNQNIFSPVTAVGQSVGNVSPQTSDATSQAHQNSNNTPAQAGNTNISPDKSAYPSQRNTPLPEVTSVITSPHTPQKYGGKKILATIFGVLLVFGGIISGVYLVQRQQNISEQAQTSDYDAQCSEIRAYDTNWNQLTSTSLGDLTPGTVVRFTVSGITSSGSFDKARFTINGIQTAEITDKKPGTDEYYYEYTIPDGSTNFTIKGQVHHTIWGWI